MKKIGMVVAMQKELTTFLTSSGVEYASTSRRGYEIVDFKIGDNSIICIQSGIGEIFAAAATQTLISEYAVDIVINFGVCGSLHGGYGVGETVLVKNVVHYDFDLSPIDETAVGQYPGEPSADIPTDEELNDVVLGIDGTIRAVRCASADKFVVDGNIKADLVSRYGADICEMESAGVLITCRRAGVPCLIIKAVSDGAGGAEEFKQMVLTASEKYVGLVCALTKKL